MNSLQVCNSLLMGNERLQMRRAAELAHDGDHDGAERVRASLGYAAHQRVDMDKTYRVERLRPR